MIPYRLKKTITVSIWCVVSLTAASAAATALSNAQDAESDASDAADQFSCLEFLC